MNLERISPIFLNEKMMVLQQPLTITKIFINFKNRIPKGLITKP